MYGCIQSSIFTMNADLYHQMNEQDEVTNEISRRWVLLKNIPCSINAIMESGGSATSDNKTFDKEYREDLETKMHTSEQLNKRWRVSNIKNNNNESIYNEIEKVSNSPTIFEVYASHPIVDLFGNIQYYENHLKRVSVQENDFHTSF